MKFFQNTDFQKGIPGMNRVLWSPLDQFKGFPTLPSTNMTAGETVTAVGDFTFGTGGGWLQLFNDLYKGSEMEQKSIGDTAAPGMDTMGKGRVLGMTPQLLEQYNNMLGIPGIAMYQDANCGLNEWWVIGCNCDPAFFTFDFKSGQKGGNDAKGATFEMKSACDTYKYTGAITIAPYMIISLTIIND